MISLFVFNFPNEVITNAYEIEKKKAWTRFNSILINLLIKDVPTFVTAHTFCASQDIPVSYG